MRDANNIGATPLMASLKNGHLDAANLLFDGGARLDVGVSDKDGRCPMSYACINNDATAVKWLKARFNENKRIDTRIAEEADQSQSDSGSRGSNRNYGIDHR